MPLRQLMDDPDYRRLKYVRYADDFLLGLHWPKSRGGRDQAETWGVPTR